MPKRYITKNPLRSIIAPLAFLVIAAGLGVFVAAAPLHWVVAGVVGVALVPLLATWHSWVVGASERVLLSVAVVSLILLRLPQLSHNLIVHVVVLVPFAVSIAIGSSGARPTNRITTAGIWAFLAVLTIEVLRGGFSGAHGKISGAALSAFTYLVLSAFGWKLFTSATSDRQLRDRFIAVALAPSAYAAVNIALLFLKITPPDLDQSSVALHTPADLLALLGVHVDRINFPLGLSINNFSVICGVGMSSALVLAARFRRFVRTASLFGAAACLYCLLRGDSRATLLFAILFAVLVIKAPRLRVSGLALIAPLAPVALIAIFGTLAQTQLGQSETHRGRDIATGSGRTEIWEGVWMHIREGNAEDVIGYGAAGQIPSGAAKNYVSVFHGQEDPERFPVHNAFLQQLLDGGYIGVVALMAIMFLTLEGLSIHARGEVGAAASAAVAGMLTLLFAGFTEVAPSYYAEETLGFLLLVSWGAATAIRRRPGTPLAHEELHPTTLAPPRVQLGRGLSR